MKRKEKKENDKLAREERTREGKMDRKRGGKGGGRRREMERESEIEGMLTGDAPSGHGVLLNALDVLRN